MASYRETAIAQNSGDEIDFDYDVAPELHCYDDATSCPACTTKIFDDCLSCASYNDCFGGED